MGANYNNFQSAEKPNAYSAKIKIIFCERARVSHKNDDYALLVLFLFIISARLFSVCYAMHVNGLLVIQ
jgi:hypothetical protein